MEKCRVPAQKSHPYSRPTLGTHSPDPMAESPLPLQVITALLPEPIITQQISSFQSETLLHLTNSYATALLIPAFLLESIN